MNVLSIYSVQLEKDEANNKINSLPNILVFEVAFGVFVRIEKESRFTHKKS